MVLKDAKEIGLLLGGLAVVTAGGYLAWKNLWKKKMRQVAVLSQILLYPVKSCKPVAFETAFCGECGLEPIKGVADRKWMLVRTRDGQLRSQRNFSMMSQITPSFPNSVDGKIEWLDLDAPGMDTLSLPIFQAADKQKVITCNVHGCVVEGQDCGRQAADWFCKFLNSAEDLRLVVFLGGDKDNTKHPRRHYARSADYQLRYADKSPYMLMSQQSVQVLNEKLDDEKVTVYNFRPNIVVTKTKAFGEDFWGKVEIGKVVLKRLEACSRCVLTTVNPENGVRNKSNQPLKMLKTFRMCQTSERNMYKDSPLLGVHFGPERCGIISVGDQVFANYI